MKIEGAIVRLFFCLFFMKFKLIFLFIGFILIQCQPSSDVKAEFEVKNRILNTELRKYIPQLVELRNQTIEDRANHPDELHVHILTTENHVYVHTSVMDCVDASFYSFSENIESKNYEIWVDERSIRPERYFDLKDAKLIERDNEVQICHDWYWLKAKFSQVNSDLKLTKISSFYDNTYLEEDFYDKEDSAFFYKIEVLMVEPEPVPEFPVK